MCTFPLYNTRYNYILPGADVGIFTGCCCLALEDGNVALKQEISLICKLYTVLYGGIDYEVVD